MAVKIEMDINPVFVKKLGEKILLRADMTLERLLQDIEASAVVPFDIGTLQGSGFSTDAHFTDDDTVEGRINYDTPYARRLYFSEGYNFQTVHNQNAKDHWMEDYLEGGAQAGFASETFEKILKGLLK